MGYFDSQCPPPPLFGPWSVDVADARAASIERGAVTQSVLHSETRQHALLAWIHWPEEPGPDEREAVEALRREILELPTLAAEHDQPHRMRIIDTGFADGPYFVMQSGPGLPLREVYKGAGRGRGEILYRLRPWAEKDEEFYRDGHGEARIGPDHYAERVIEAPIERRFALRIVADAAMALADLHDAGLYHGALTVDRIFLKDSGAVMVSHFGVERGERGRRLCSASAPPLGAHGVCHVAPEQLLDPEAVGPAADVFALGVILYELLTFSHLYRAKTQSLLTEQVLSSTLPAPSTVVDGLPALVDDIVLQALAHDPELRFRSAGALARSLSLALEQEPPCGPNELADVVAAAHRGGSGRRIAFW